MVPFLGKWWEATELFLNNGLKRKTILEYIGLRKKRLDTLGVVISASDSGSPDSMNCLYRIKD